MPTSALVFMAVLPPPSQKRAVAFLQGHRVLINTNASAKWICFGKKGQSTL